MNPVNRQLLLVKYLYQRGEDALAEKGMFSDGLAVSLFQDAVETLLCTIAREIGVTLPKQMVAFDAYWGLIENGPNANGRKLPTNAKMIQLNNARIGFKHHGNVPSRSTALGLQSHAEQFLVEACSTFFGLDFKAISSVDLVQNESVRKHLRLATDAIIAGNAKLALEECGLAYRHLTEELNILLPTISASFSLGDLLSDLETVREVSREEARLKQIELAVSTVRNFSLAASLRIPLPAYRRFMAIVPSTIRRNKDFVAWWVDETKPMSMDDAAFAIRYVTDFSIALEMTLGGVTSQPEGEPPLSPFRHS